jgi:hypothetical protein
MYFFVVCEQEVVLSLYTMYDLKNLSCSTAAILLAISVPGYVVYKRYISPRITKDQTTETLIQSMEEEQNILESKLKLEMRTKPAYVDPQIYYVRRLERIKSTSRYLYELVNNNLDQGNKQFWIPCDENDPVILNVVRRMLIDELNYNGYTVEVTLTTNESTNDQNTNDQIERNKQGEYTKFRFEITII